MSDIYYYERRDGSVLATYGIDSFLSVNPLTKRVFRLDSEKLKCVHDNDTQPWGYYLDKDESFLILLKAPEPVGSTSILDTDDFYP